MTYTFILVTEVGCSLFLSEKFGSFKIVPLPSWWVAAVDLYLLAGSPVIVANLWEVTDKGIDRFAKAMFDCCLEERLTDSVGCVHYNLITEKFNSMQITGTKGNAKKKTSRKTVLENLDTSVRNGCCNHRPKIGSFMGQARKAYKLPYLIGASPVCYGVPTGIRRKKDL